MNPSPLTPLVPIYAAAVSVKNRAYDRGWLEPKRLRAPVVSIGNLSVGGSGKTPLVIRLVQLLTAQGISVDVLSRGFGRSSSEVARVDPAGSAEQFGDEPLLIAQNASVPMYASVPVYVGASRYAAGLMAERESPQSGIHLLDDGFQHRKLARDVDIVVVHSSDFAQQLLPAGRLREPLSSLRRASVVVLRAEDAARERELRERGIEAPIWFQHRRLVVERGGPAIAFCGIARPDEFFAALRKNGIDLAGTKSFRDHHSYTDADIDAILKLCHATGVKRCITTEKDAVRMSREHRARLASAVSLEAAKLEVSLTDEPSVVRKVLSLIMRK